MGGCQEAPGILNTIRERLQIKLEGDVPIKDHEPATEIGLFPPLLRRFKFPDHCVGAVLGPDGKKALNLRSTFDISLVGIWNDKFQTTTEAWPVADYKVKKGDWGLIACVPDKRTGRASPLDSERDRPFRELCHFETF